MKNKILLIGLLASYLFSCTDPQIIGLEIQPESDKITISSLDQNSPFLLSAHAIDSVRSDEPLYALLGHYVSPNFKGTKASFSNQLLLSENAVDFGQNAVLDSAILTLTYAGYYGDTTSQMSIKIQQLNQEIFFDSSYYSNTILSSSPFSTPLEFQFTPKPNTKVFANNDTVGVKSESFRVDAIGQLILDAGSEHLVDNATFLSYFKGIQLSVVDNSTSSSILYFNLKDGGSKLSLYYNDSLTYDLLIGSGAARINHFEMDDSQFLNTVYGVQSMGGVELQLTFNQLQQLKQNLNNKVINQALLKFNVQNSSDLNPAHTNLSLVRLDSSGAKYFLEDILEGQPHFGGELDNNQYVFNISKYMLDLLQEKYSDSTLVLVPTGEVINANRTELSQDIELNIIYTEF
jgi:hypothetical protein